MHAGLLVRRRFSVRISRLSGIALCVALVLFATESVPFGFTHRNSPTSKKFLIEAMGGGVALLDYNNDGLLDVFFVNSGRLDENATSTADFSRRDPAFWNRLYRQNPGGTFTDVTAAAGLATAANSYGMGVARRLLMATTRPMLRCESCNAVIQLRSEVRDCVQTLSGRLS